ncbi:MAG: MutS-related protein [Blautia sp.]|jgi:hypothetical protein
MNPLLLYAGVIAALLVATALLMAWNNWKQKRRLRRRLRNQWGRVCEREYSLEEISNISHYAMRKEQDASFFIDDITWNDLDMDRVFVRINQTVSSPGEDYLYYLLRTPKTEWKSLKEQEQLVEFFAEHEQEREEMQLLLSEVGKGRHGSVSDAVFLLDDAPVLNRIPHIGAALLLLACFLYMLFRPVPGIFCFIILCAVNTGTYYGGKDRKIVGVYLYCFENLLRMLSAAKKMEKISWPEVQKELGNIREARKVFARFKRGSFLVIGNDSSSNILYLLMDYVRMIAHVDLIKYNSMLMEVKAHQREVMMLLDGMGKMDAAMSIASFRMTLPFYCQPDFTSLDVCLQADNLYHPLIADAVANSISIERGAVVTGSNASGKSTFLKNIAVNALLAQTVNTCTATYYRSPMFRIYTSMALRDDLYKGESYFIVEIKSIQRILKASQEGTPVLCIVDEVLRGTNTVERIAASSRILKELAKPNVICFAATHDIELSYILEEFYDNYHFEEEIREKDVLFNYLLQKGRATTRNAIRLLDMLGYQDTIVTEAREAAELFDEKGIWEKIRKENGACW